MKSFAWRNKTWRDRTLLLGSVVILVLLASHPELRLLVPLVDALGIDLFVMLLGAQAWQYFKPLAVMLYCALARPFARMSYSSVIFFFGYLGPYIDARISNSAPDQRLAL